MTFVFREVVLQSLIAFFIAAGAGPSFNPEVVSTSRNQVLDEQDRGLDSLYEVIVRQKRIAQNIEGEVGVQVQLLHNLWVLGGVASLSFMTKGSSVQSLL